MLSFFKNNNGTRADLNKKQLGRHVSDFKSAKWGEFREMLLKDIVKLCSSTKNYRSFSLKII